VVGLARDAEILEAGIQANPVRVKVGSEIVQVEIVGDIAIEFTVMRIARVSLGGAPNLPGQGRVTAEYGQAGGRVDGSMDAKAGTRVGTRDSVRFEDSIADAVLSQNAIHSLAVTALRQPEAFGPSPEELFETGEAHADLSANSRRTHSQERKIAMGGGGGDDLDMAGRHEGPECLNKIAAAAINNLAADPHEALGVEVRQSLGRWL